MFSIKGVDLASHAFYINLKESTDRNDHVQKQISQYSINDLDRFEAIRNIEIPPSSATDSQLAVFDMARKNNLESVAVFEDDFLIEPRPSAMRNFYMGYGIEEYLELIKKEIDNIEWDVFMLGLNLRKKTLPITKHISRVFKSTGAWAYIIKKNAYEFLLEHTNYNRDRMAIDDLLPELTYRGFNCITSNLCLANHAPGFASTMQPQFLSTDYREWILGGYHCHIWDNIEDNRTDNIEEFMEILWNRKNNARNYIVRLHNFNGNINKLEKLEHTVPDFRNCYMELMDLDYPDINYFMNVESKHLLNKPGRLRADWLPKQFYDIDLAKI